MVVEELLRSKKISYLPSGRDYLIRCLNPEHEDKNPSLRVDKITGIFNCLSCGFSGNVFKFFGQKANHLEVRRAKLRNAIQSKLYQTSGLQMPSDAVPFDKDWRGISAATIKRFEAFELHSNPEFAGRLVFPIKDITGKIVAFCGRNHRDGTGFNKYHFSPPGAKLPLFPIVKPIAGRVIIVEGIYDMLKLQDNGVYNACCAFGVNKVDEDKINILKMQGVSAIDIFYDSDDAGQKAAAALYEELESRYEMEAKIIRCNDAKDPGDLTAQQVLKIKEELYG